MYRPSALSQRNGPRVAERQGGTVYYLHGDHLGSVSLTTTSSGAQQMTSRYNLFDSVRSSSGGAVSDYRFTGQRQESLGNNWIYDYGGRFYDSLVARFVSADTLVPSAGNPQALNRYSYSYNNPLKYIDPSGHRAIADDTEEGGECYFVQQCLDTPDEIDWLVDELVTKATSDEILVIEDLLTQPPTGPGSDSPLAPGRNFVQANIDFRELVATGHPYDIKNEAQQLYGPDFKVAGKNYNQDITGNILFGYVGAKAGFDSTWLQAGAGVAQVWDKMVVTRQPDAVGPLNTFFDEPRDNAATKVGVGLYQSNGTNLARKQLITAIDKNSDALRVQTTPWVGNSINTVIQAGQPMVAPWIR